MIIIYCKTIKYELKSERLHFKETANTEKASLLQKDFLSMGILAILAGISTRIILHFAELQAITPINLVFGIYHLLPPILYTIIPQEKIFFTPLHRYS